MTIGHIVRRLLFYLGLAVASLVILSLIFAVSISMHVTLPLRWVMLAAFTGVLLFTMVKTDRAYWNRPVFWLICVGVLVVHLTVFIPILRSYREFRSVWWVPIVLVEASVFGPLCDLLLLCPRLHKE